MEFPPLDFDRIRTYPIRERPNQVHRDRLARAWKTGGSFAQFIDSLPRIHAGNDFRAVVDATVAAVRNRRPVVAMMGAHTIQCGLNPILIDLIKRGVISAVAFDGGGATHDFELASIGETSGDVAGDLDDDSFGMIDETGRLMNQALAAGVTQGIGAGRALGEAIVTGQFRNRESSILHQSVVSKIPATVHLAIGADIMHQHPTTDGGVLGEAAYLDFQKFASVIATLEGGVALHLGSTGILPEVFLKALTIARNLGHKVGKFTTVTFDVIRQDRPAHKDGRGHHLIGHHELLVPLWAAAITEQLS